MHLVCAYDIVQNADREAFFRLPKVLSCCSLATKLTVYMHIYIQASVDGGGSRRIAGCAGGGSHRGKLDAHAHEKKRAAGCYRVCKRPIRGMGVRANDRCQYIVSFMETRVQGTSRKHEAGLRFSICKA